MRRFSPLYCLASALLLFASCAREEVVLTENDVKTRVDSIVRLQSEFARQRAAEDLDRRQAIEVKVKTDSILEARKNGAPPPKQDEPSGPPAIFQPPTDREP